jgi:hypothetical protein
VSDREPPLDAILAAPDDDAPRLAWAAAVGGERGELVEAQCRLAGTLTRPERKALLARELRLSSGCEQWWKWKVRAGSPTYRRGFVDELWIQPDEFVAHSETVLDHAPLLRALHLHSIGADVSRYHYDSPEAAWEMRAQLLEEAFRRIPPRRIHSLRLGSASVSMRGDYDELPTSTDFGDAVARMVAGAPSLAGLRSLTLGGAITSAALDALCGLPLEEFGTWDERLDRGAIEALQRFPHLRRLRISPGPVGSSLGALLDAPEAARLTALTVQPLDDDDLARIAAAPRLADLRHLDLGRSDAITARGIRALAESNVLRLGSFTLESARLDDISPMRASPVFAQVRDLRLNFCRLDARAIPVLRALPALERVALAGGGNRMPADTREQLDEVPEVHVDPPLRTGPSKH